MILVLLGLICVGAAVAVGIDVWQENSNHLAVQGFGHTFFQAPWVAIVVGAVCGALIVVGLALFFAGAASRRRLVTDRRAAVRDRERLVQQANSERAAREQAERDRAAATAEAERARAAAAEQNRVTGTTAEAPRMTTSAQEERPAL
jgi:biopolymer transport protein ExbB/TolQ